ncbi:hypothetical protein IU470_14285 [Nocardia abscessus]|uniref:Uncharacterized protein n=1 Tax=Nocardia abscessus TaxID=120957 RepID=A0ABS0C7B1_9NOCA|nr:hypothetical protein [Nocardia abscessus]MBF6226264.1 hypothetical protein [Nocardia abscessus]
MTATQIAVLCSLAGAAGLVATIGLLHGPANRRRRLDLAQHGIAQRIPATVLPVCPIGRPQRVPIEPLTVAEAHELMQRHRICEPSECVYKLAAFRTLIEAGYMRDPHAEGA